tara:strand:+ start:139 stop:585 length:447 start_codon:yes stop_codon:yes gene_type:complete
MIISCEKCTKKFNIQDNLIPDEGRLLQCGSCNHKWFYKLPDQNIKLEADSEIILDEKKKILEKIIETSKPIKKKEDKISDNKTIQIRKKKPNILKGAMVLIISIIALIILIDTFKFHLEKYIPGINSVLNNLYETLKDLSLFAKDLIN